MTIHDARQIGRAKGRRSVATLLLILTSMAGCTAQTAPPLEEGIGSAPAGLTTTPCAGAGCIDIVVDPAQVVVEPDYTGHPSGVDFKSGSVSVDGETPTDFYTNLVDIDVMTQAEADSYALLEALTLIEMPPLWMMDAWPDSRTYLYSTTGSTPGCTATELADALYAVDTDLANTEVRLSSNDALQGLCVVTRSLAAGHDVDVEMHNAVDDSYFVGSFNAGAPAPVSAFTPNVADWFSHGMQTRQPGFGVYQAWAALQATLRTNTANVFIADRGFVAADVDRPANATNHTVLGSTWGNGPAGTPFHGNQTMSVAIGDPTNSEQGVGTAGPYSVGRVARVRGLRSMRLAVDQARESAQPSIVSFARGVKVGRLRRRVMGRKFRRSVDRGLNNNVLTVSSSGNAGVNLDGGRARYPCEADDVLCVGGVDPDGMGGFVNVFNFGNRVDIYAPRNGPTGNPSGGDALVEFNGTSYAAPYVSGVAALVWAADPTLTPIEVRDILLSNPGNTVTTPDGRVRPIVWPWGAVTAALGSAPPLAVIDLTGPNFLEGLTLTTADTITLRATVPAFAPGNVDLRWETNTEGMIATQSNVAPGTTVQFLWSPNVAGDVGLNLVTQFAGVVGGPVTLENHQFSVAVPPGFPFIVRSFFTEGSEVDLPSGDRTIEACVEARDPSLPGTPSPLITGGDVEWIPPSGPSLFNECVTVTVTPCTSTTFDIEVTGSTGNTTQGLLVYSGLC